MTLWLNRSGRHCEHESKFLHDGRIYLTWNELDHDLSQLSTLCERNAFTRDGDTPLNYPLVNIKNWCKNAFEVVNQLRMNTGNSHQRYDIMLLYFITETHLRRACVPID